MLCRRLSLLLVLSMLDGCSWILPFTGADPGDGPTVVDLKIKDRDFEVDSSARLDRGAPPDNGQKKVDGSLTPMDSQTAGDAGSGTISIQAGRFNSFSGVNQVGWAMGIQPPLSGELFLLCGVTSGTVTNVRTSQPGVPMTRVTPPYVGTPSAEIWQGTGSFTNGSIIEVFATLSTNASCIPVVAGGASPSLVKSMGPNAATSTKISDQTTAGSHQVVLAIAAASETISPLAPPLLSLMNEVILPSTGSAAAGYALGTGGVLTFQFTSTNTASWALAWVQLRPL